MIDETKRTLPPGSGAAARTSRSIPWVIGRNPTVRRIAEHARRVAEVECAALISGETGTGKEILAREIHSRGPRASRPFIPVNCAALTVSLAESQLFGHEKGAFTGASGSSLGVFRSAEGGVVFLDEVGEMPKELQPKLLRVLQEREVTPVGSSQPRQVDVQVLAATNRDLEAEVTEGNFREDLYYRLNMVELRVPPLRERIDDMGEFVEFFSQQFARRYHQSVWRLDADSLLRFCEYRWPGNIRELAHVIEQSYVLACEPNVPDGETARTCSSALPHLNLNRLRREAVLQALQATRGHKGRAAKLLGVHANTLTRMLGQLKIDDTDHRDPLAVGSGASRRRSARKR